MNRTPNDQAAELVKQVFGEASLNNQDLIAHINVLLGFLNREFKHNQSEKKSINFKLELDSLKELQKKIRDLTNEINNAGVKETVSSLARSIRGLNELAKYTNGIDRNTKKNFADKEEKGRNPDSVTKHIARTWVVKICQKKYFQKIKKSRETQIQNFFRFLKSDLNYNLGGASKAARSSSLQYCNDNFFSECIWGNQIDSYYLSNLRQYLSKNEFEIFSEYFKITFNNTEPEDHELNEPDAFSSTLPIFANKDCSGCSTFYRESVELLANIRHLKWELKIKIDEIVRLKKTIDSITANK